MQYSKSFKEDFSHKVQLFWEDHKNCRNLPYGFDIYLVNVKILKQIAQIVVIFSEKLNFNITLSRWQQ